MRFTPVCQDHSQLASAANATCGASACAVRGWCGIYHVFRDSKHVGCVHSCMVHILIYIYIFVYLISLYIYFSGWCLHGKWGAARSEEPNFTCAESVTSATCNTRFDSSMRPSVCMSPCPKTASLMMVVLEPKVEVRTFLQADGQRFVTFAVRRLEPHVSTWTSMVRMWITCRTGNLFSFVLNSCRNFKPIYYLILI